MFTLIHKFRLDQGRGETTMPVLSDRVDIIVITDEAHRSQYDTLALNMRQALPNASFMGFTGTPLIAGEELTRQEFGDYVSIYNFRDAIEDGATVPLYYENRIPELQLVNDDFADELAALLEAAELDEDAEGQLVRQFARQYTLITRPERLRTIARTWSRTSSAVASPARRCTSGSTRPPRSACTTWSRRRGPSTSPSYGPSTMRCRSWSGRGWQSRIELMETTDMAVVVCQAQNELADLDAMGLDIRPHRERMNGEDLDEKFKDPDDPLRIVFVCAMWMTGFDAPSVSTIYLDRPMRNHTLMQTIARANRVFPDKDNGLIVDYIGVFRNLEKALAIYGAANAEPGRLADPGRRRAGGRARRSPSTRSIASVRALRRRPRRRCGKRRASSSSPSETPPSRRCSSTRTTRTDVPGLGPPGPQAVQGPAARPGGRRAAGAPSPSSGRSPSASPS